MARVARLDELDTIRVAGVNWRPVRRALGITVDAYKIAAAGLADHPDHPSLHYNLRLFCVAGRRH
jgi:hypothetical protein